MTRAAAPAAFPSVPHAPHVAHTLKRLLPGIFQDPVQITLATALVNAGCSLQALMALLGHVSAEMSLRYGRLFDATVRDEYTRALALAKARLGPVLPGERTQLPLAAITGGNWRETPLIKARLAGGYCLRTAAQGSCAYANACGTQSWSFALAA